MPPKQKKAVKRAAEDASACDTKRTKNSSQIDLKELVKSSCDQSWIDALDAELDKAYVSSLTSKLNADYAAGKLVFPPREQIFETLRLTPLDKVKVVLIGQDPYHDDGQAHGLAFSVCHGIKVPPSLRNMYNELVDDIDGFVAPEHGCLTHWAEQGVILLNATLTVIAHAANSQAKHGWQTLTDAIIRTIGAKCDHVVFMLWGNFAKKKAELIDASKHTILESGHPSPLSVRHFKGCKHFSLANADLVKHGLTAIDWTLDEENSSPKKGAQKSIKSFFAAKAK